MMALVSQQCILQRDNSALSVYVAGNEEFTFSKYGKTLVINKENHMIYKTNLLWVNHTKE